MQKVECPICGNSVFLAPSAATVEVRGRIDASRCPRLRHLQGQGDEIDDPSECEDMEAALEAALAALSGRSADLAGPFGAEPGGAPAADPLAAWRDERFARRRFKRWTTSQPGQVGLAGQRHRCVVRDISPGGACVALHDVTAVRPDAYVVLTLEGFGAVPAEIRQVDEADEIARLYFLHDADRQLALARWLMSLPSAPPLGN